MKSTESPTTGTLTFQEGEWQQTGQMHKFQEENEGGEERWSGQARGDI